MVALEATEPFLKFIEGKTFTLRKSVVDSKQKKKNPEQNKTDPHFRMLVWCHTG